MRQKEGCALDEIDRTLLRLLLEDSAATSTELSKQVNLSIPAVNKRIARLRQSGVIERFTVQVNAEKVGKSVQAFVLVVVSRYAKSEELLRSVQADPDILDCYAVTGEYDYLLRICAKDISDLEEKLLRLKENECVAKSHTLFNLMTHKHISGPLPEQIKEIPL